MNKQHSSRKAHWFTLILLIIISLLSAALPPQRVGAAAVESIHLTSTAATTHTYLLSADQDTQISSMNETPWGAAKQLHAWQGGSDYWWSLFHFDLSSVPPGVSVLSATVKLYMLWSDGTPVTLHRVTTAWDEDVDTRLTLGNAYDPAPTTSFMPAFIGQYSTVNLTGLVQAWLDGVHPNDGILLKAAPNGNHIFVSKEAIISSQRPVLELVVAAQTVTLDAGQDTWLQKAQPGVNYGGCDALTVDVAGGGLGDGRTLLRFDLSEIPVGAQIVAADLRMTKTGGDNTTKQVEARRVLSAWSEGSGGCAGISGAASWNQRQTGVNWGSAGGAMGAAALASVTVGGNGVYTWQVTAAAQQWIAERSTNYGLLLGSPELGAPKFVFASSEHAQAANRPQLSVRYVGGQPGIGNRLWDDRNRNGSQDVGEPGLSNLTVKLYTGLCETATGAAFRTTISGADGDYAFAPLDAGAYCVQVDTTTLPIGYLLTTNNPSLDVTLSSGQFFADADFGYASATADDRLAVGAYAPCADAAWLQQLAQSYGATITDQNPRTCGYTLQAAPATLPALQAAIDADPHTRHAGPDGLAQGEFTPNDPDYNDPSKVYGPQQINAPAAWDVTLGDPNLIVAIVDTGIDPGHPEFSGRLLAGFDFVNGDADARDDHGHGTHVAGIAAAGINNGIGIAGIAGVSKILPVKALSANNTGWWSEIADGITWAVDQGARVINLSATGTVDSQRLRDAIAYANARNVTVVASAGNNSTGEVRYPASNEGVIAVGATTSTGVRWTLSNFGPNVDLMAPGASVYSSHWSAAGGSSYRSLNGTSMAAPHVAGAALLLLSRNPNLTSAEVKDLLLDTAVDLDAPGVDSLTGYGLLNVQTALTGTPVGASVTLTSGLDANLVVDANGNGLVDVGDTLRYDLTAVSPAAMSNVVVSATTPSHTTYVSDSTRLNGIPVRDDDAPKTAQPLDEGGLNIGALAANSSALLSFDVVVGQLPRGVYAVVGQATVQTTVPQNLSVTTPVAGTLLAAAVDKTSAQIGQSLTYTFSTDYLGNELLSNVVVTAGMPAGATYAAGSANAGGAENGGVVTWNLGSNAPGAPGYAAGSGGPTVLSARQDASVTSARANNNFGGQSQLGVNSVYHSLVEFDLSGIPANSPIAYAELVLDRVGGTGSPTGSIEVRALTQFWEEGAQSDAACTDGVTWTNRDCNPVAAWTTAGGDFNATVYATSAIVTGVNTWDVTGLVQAWADGTLTNNGLLLQMASGADSHNFSSKEGATAPKLRITFGPKTGTAVWRSANLTTPKYTQWDGVAFGAAANSASVGGAWRTIQGAASPTRNEKIFVGIHTSSGPGFINGERWNGSTWSALPLNQLNATQTALSYLYSFDVEYEQQSGDAILVWDNNTASNMLQYSVWDGTSWSAKTTIAAYAGAEPQQMHLAFKPGGDEMVLVVSDANADHYALVWNGSSWGNAVTLNTSGVDQYNQRALHVAYEAQTGRALVLYGKLNDTKPYYRIWNGTSWSAENSIAAPGGLTAQASLFNVASDPNSNRIVLAVMDHGTGSSGSYTVWLTVWDGSSWSAATNVYSSANSDQIPNVAVAFEGQSGQALAAWGTTGSVIQYRTWSSGGGWSTTSSLTIGGAPYAITLDPHPFSDRIMLTVQNSLQDTQYALWSGTGWGAKGTHDAGSVELLTQPFATVWDAVYGATSQVSQSSDDAEEAGPGATGSHTPGYIDFTSSDIEFTTDNDTTGGYSGGTQKIGLRFNTMNVPQGATITNATIVLRAEAADSPNTNTGATNLTIRGQAADHATTFTSTAYDITNRSTTSASVTWSPAAWTGGADYSTPDLKAIVQEIVNRSGWASGNSMAFIVTGSGSRTAESWDGAGANPARLVIGYTLPSAPSLGNVMVTAPTLVTSGGLITLTMSLTASQSIANVTPSAPVITGTNGVNATLVSGPTPASAAVGPAGATFTWVYRATGASAIGQLSFGGSASSSATTWPDATTNSVIVHPPLTLRATVAGAPAGGGPIRTTGFIRDAGDRLPSNASNTPTTGLFGVIGDRIWNDADGDAIQDGSESGIANVTVQLTGGSGGLRTAVTDGAGLYSFGNLAAGTYTVTIDESTLSPDFELLTTPYPPLVALQDGMAYAAADVGLKALTMAIGDVIWYDADTDGLQDAHEPGIGNITLDLYYDDGDGQFDPSFDFLVDSTTSDASGAYRLTALAEGAHFVNVTDAAGLLNGLLHTLGGQSVTDPSPPIMLTVGQHQRDVDFGYVRVPAAGHGLIGDLVWVDGDGNGVRALNEPILIGVTVCATPTAGGQPRCAVTDSNGRYLIEAPAGEYSVTPSGQPAGLQPSTPNRLTVNLMAGQQQLAVDFGFSGGSVPLGGIGGTIWQDLPVDDLVDGVYTSASEPGIPDVSVGLIRDSDGSGAWSGVEPYIAAFSTIGGDYHFDGLPAGAYLVRVTDTRRVLRRFAVTRPGPLGAAGADHQNKPQPYPLVLAPGGVDTSADFGYREYEVFGQDDPPPPGLIGDQVWLDVDGDGRYDPNTGDAPLSGVTLLLHNSAGAQLAASTTGIDGKYLFSDLPAGDYRVSVNDAFAVLGDAVVNTAAAATGQDNVGQVQPYAVTLGLNTSDMTADFAYSNPPVSYLLDARLANAGSVRPGQPLAFSIMVTNTGAVSITQAALRLSYSPSYLRLVSATPLANDNGDDGQLDWSDLTVSFGRDLAPGQGFGVEVEFIALADTTMLPPDGATGTVAAVSGAWAKSYALAPQAAQAGARIEAPTAPLLGEHKLELLADGVALSWTTLNESNVAGFRIQRQIDGGEMTLLSEQMIVAQKSGAAEGAAYSFVDANAALDAQHSYLLEVALLNGGTVQVDLGAITISPERVYLPVISR